MKDIFSEKKMAGLETESVIFETIPLGVIFFDPEGNIFSMNERAEKLLNIKVKDLKGMRSVNYDWGFINEDHSPLRKTDYFSATVIRSKKVYSRVIGFSAKKNSIYGWAKVTGVPVFDNESGKFKGGYVIFEDITEKKRLGEEAKLAKDRFVKTVLRLENAVFIFDASKSVRILDINPAVTKMFGYEKAEVVGKEWKFLLGHNAKSADFEKIMMTSIGEIGHLPSTEFIAIRKNEETFPVEVSVDPLTDDKNNNTGWVAVVRDISAWKQAEQKLTEQNVLLGEKNLALKEMLNVIALERKEMADNVSANIETLVFPILGKLRAKDISKKYLKILKNNLSELTGKFGRKLVDVNERLTPREIEVCNFIKNGVKTKEIAELLHVSHQTIDKHRKNIRKKMRLSNKKINLSAYLQKT